MGTPNSLYPSQTFPVRLLRMKNLTATICLTIAVFLGGVGVSESADFRDCERTYKKNYDTAIRLCREFCFATWLPI